MQRTVGKIYGIALLSGGLDSLVSLAKANTSVNIKLALTFDYYQRSNKMEIESAKKISEYYGLKHLVMKLSWLKDVTGTALVDRRKKIPKFSIKDLDNKSKTLESSKDVWVPNRNAVFINIAASIAEGLGYKAIITGFNKEEAETFPDNSAGFIKAINESLRFSTLNGVEVLSPTQLINKAEIVKLGIELKVPFRYIYSCYLNSFDGKMCGVCESCQRLKRAFHRTGYYALISKRFKVA